jgi:hypothetical protein
MTRVYLRVPLHRQEAARNVHGNITGGLAAGFVLLASRSRTVPRPGVQSALTPYGSICHDHAYGGRSHAQRSSD